MRNLTKKLIVAAAVVAILTTAAVGIANSRYGNAKADRLVTAFEARFGEWSQYGNAEADRGGDECLPISASPVVKPCF